MLYKKNNPPTGHMISEKKMQSKNPKILTNSVARYLKVIKSCFKKHAHVAKITILLGQDTQWVRKICGLGTLFNQTVEKKKSL